LCFLGVFWGSFLGNFFYMILKARDDSFSCAPSRTTRIDVQAQHPGSAGKYGPRACRHSSNIIRLRRASRGVSSAALGVRSISVHGGLGLCIKRALEGPTSRWQGRWRGESLWVARNPWTSACGGVPHGPGPVAVVLAAADTAVADDAAVVLVPETARHSGGDGKIGRYHRPRLGHLQRRVAGDLHPAPHHDQRLPQRRPPTGHLRGTASSRRLRGALRPQRACVPPR